jgi:Holliday junction DNA helicase RuvA
MPYPFGALPEEGGKGMIARIEGTLLEKRPDEAIVDVNGVGYRLFISLATYEKLPALGGKALLSAITVAREDALSLYGFHDAQEKEVFGKLVSVSRVGPKLAIQILSGVNAGDLKSIIARRDEAALSRVHGVGKKTAERIILELKDKFVSIPGESASAGAASYISDSIEALINLGYKRGQAEKAVMKVSAGGESNLSTIIRKSLKELS